MQLQSILVFSVYASRRICKMAQNVPFPLVFLQRTAYPDLASGDHRTVDVSWIRFSSKPTLSKSKFQQSTRLKASDIRQGYVQSSLGSVELPKNHHYIKWSSLLQVWKQVHFCWNRSWVPSLRIFTAKLLCAAQSAHSREVASYVGLKLSRR